VAPTFPPRLTIFGAYHWIESIRTGRLTSTGTVMIAVLPLVVAITALLQAFVMDVSQSPGAYETREYVRYLLFEARRDSRTRLPVRPPARALR